MDRRRLAWRLVGFGLAAVLIGLVMTHGALFMVGLVTAATGSVWVLSLKKQGL